jgi:CO/xanthine dehydrogenase FAD-binding subunit
MIAATPEGGLDIGAMVRLAQIERSAVVRQAAPVVADTLLTHSNVRVRNVATVGGNLAHGDPHMDLPPVLIALGASVRVVGPSGERDIPVEELITGYMPTVLGTDELIAALRTVADGTPRHLCQDHRAHGRCWPALGIAASIGVADVRIAIGAATEIPMRLTQTEALLLAGGSMRRCCAAEMRRGRSAGGRRSARLGRVQARARQVHLRRALQRRSIHERYEDRFRGPDRPLAAAGRGARQGHRPRRIRPQSAPSRHAVGKDRPQHGAARPHPPH